jgi:hypothetical protein
MPNKIWFSKINSPEEFPKIKTIYCFHPKIAKLIAKLLVKVFGWEELK